MTGPRHRRGSRYTPPKRPPIKLTEFVCESCGELAWLVHPWSCTGRRCNCDEQSGYRRTCDDCGPA